MTIDVDRGVSLRQIVKFDHKNQHKFEPDLKYGGMVVYMYKDDPGKYFDVHGKPVPDGVAKLAGFPVDRLAKARRRKEALHEFDKKLAAELAMETADEVQVLAEDGDWQVIALPEGRAKIVDKETGEPVVAAPMSEADAMLFLKTLTGTDAEIKKVDGPSKKE